MLDDPVAVKVKEALLPQINVFPETLGIGMPHCAFKRGALKINKLETPRIFV